MFNNILDIPLNRELWFIGLFIWTIVWKGLALWRSAQRGQKEWFIPLLVINTLGILEILYLYVFSSPEKKTKK